jgi:DNA mismatch endonuclease (patch repair protein)
MRAIRSKNMKPEMAVRRLVSAMGYRYRLHRHNLPGRPDMVFAGLRKVVFIHGCFWHQHASVACPLTHIPRSNVAYWRPKLERNKARDSASLQKLRSDGWDILVVWECELADPRAVSNALRRFLDRKASK